MFPKVQLLFDEIANEHELSVAQRRVAGLAALDFSNREIADMLGITLGSVHQHMNISRGKMGMNKAEMTRALFGKIEKRLD